MSNILKHPLKETLLKQIELRGRGFVFAAKDFSALGSPAALSRAFSQLVADGQIRRLLPGVFDYPRYSPLVGVRSPDMDAVVQAVARQTGHKIQLSGAQAANALGLTTQVPARAVYLTDGHNRRLHIGNQVIELRHASADAFVAGGGHKWCCGAGLGLPGPG